MMNYNALLRKKAEDNVKKQEKELTLLQDMAALIKEQLTALVVEEMCLNSTLRNIKESKTEGADTQTGQAVEESFVSQVEQLQLHVQHNYKQGNAGKQTLEGTSQRPQLPGHTWQHQSEEEEEEDDDDEEEDEEDQQDKEPSNRFFF